MVDVVAWIIEGEQEDREEIEVNCEVSIVSFSLLLS